MVENQANLNAVMATVINGLSEMVNYLKRLDDMCAAEDVKLESVVEEINNKQEQITKELLKEADKTKIVCFNKMIFWRFLYSMKTYVSEMEGKNENDKKILIKLLSTIGKEILRIEGKISRFSSTIELFWKLQPHKER